MAIDTAAKRYSFLTLVFPAPVFRPDGSVDAGDRYDLLGLYSGIILDDPTPGGGAVGDDWIIRNRRRRRA